MGRAGLSTRGPKLLCQTFAKGFLNPDSLSSLLNSGEDFAQKGSSLM